MQYYTYGYDCDLVIIEIYSLALPVQVHLQAHRPAGQPRWQMPQSHLVRSPYPACNRHHKHSLSHRRHTHGPGWRSDAYGTQKWRHLRSFEVVVRLVRLYRISWRRVAFYNVPPRNKYSVTPNRKKKAVEFSTVMASAYQGQLNAGFSKACEIFKVRSIESLKYVWELYWSVIVATFPHPKRDAERNKLWLVVWHVGQTASGWAFLQWKLSWIPEKVWLRETIISKSDIIRQLTELLQENT